MIPKAAEVSAAFLVNERMKNTRMKRFVGYLLIISLIFMLVGCAPKSSEKAKADEKKRAEFEAERQKVTAELVDEGLDVRELELETGMVKKPVTIVQISDAHINFCDDVDLIERNPSTYSTFKQRDWLAYAASSLNLDNSLKYASYFDQTVITGDTIDYISHGALDLVKTHVFDLYPDVLCTLGNHDTVRVMGLPNDVPDPSPSEERYALLEEIWPHDLYYTSRAVKDQVMVIQLHNGSGMFYKQQIEPMKKDLETARKKGYPVLLFYHIPLPLNSDLAETKEMEGLIAQNADVIKATFCGHWHKDGETAIEGKTPDGTAVSIPQYILTSTAYDSGHVLKINVR